MDKQNEQFIENEKLNSLEENDYNSIEFQSLSKNSESKSGTLKSNRKKETLKRNGKHQVPSMKQNGINKWEYKYHNIRDKIIKFIALLHLEFFKSKNGIFKLLEVSFAFLSNRRALSVLIVQDKNVSETVDFFLTVSAGAFGIITVFLMSYMLSATTYYLVRKSMFDVVFNSIIGVLYFVATISVSITENYDWSSYSQWQIYILGTACACIHLLDAILASTYAFGKTEDVA